MPSVLILCTGNSARSQMAEGLLRALSRGTFDVHSAGTTPSVVHPLAIKAMTTSDLMTLDWWLAHKDFSTHLVQLVNRWLDETAK